MRLVLGAVEGKCVGDGLAVGERDGLVRPGVQVGCGVQYVPTRCRGEYARTGVIRREMHEEGIGADDRTVDREFDGDARAAERSVDEEIDCRSGRRIDDAACGQGTDGGEEQSWG